MNESPVHPVADEELPCPQCGYDLRSLPAGTCPECGEPFDPAELRQSQIPWSYRKQIGRFRAYWRTVWLVMFRNKRFCQEVAHPVSYRDARLFQWVTIGHVLVSLAVLVTGLYIHGEFEPVLWAVPRVWPLAMALVTVLLFLLGVTGVHTYWFHPRALPLGRQNRAVALSYYCCAPLAWTPATVSLIGAGLFVMELFDPTWVMQWTGGIVFLLMAITLLVQIVELWWLPVTMVRLVAGRKTAGQLALAASLPVLWMLLGFFTLLFIPGIGFWLWIVYASLVG